MSIYCLIYSRSYSKDHRWIFCPSHTLSTDEGRKLLRIWRTWGVMESFAALRTARTGKNYSIISYNATTGFYDKVNRPIRALEGLTSVDSGAWKVLAGYLYSCIKEGKSLDIYKYAEEKIWVYTVRL